MPETVINQAVASDSTRSRRSGFLREFNRIGQRRLLQLGFGGLAGYATYDGLYELIASNVTEGKPDLGVHTIIILSSSILVLMIIFLLSRLRDAKSIIRILLYSFCYLVLTFVTIGLGFGFYWKWFHSLQVQAQGEQAAVTRVRSDLEIAEGRIKALAGTLAALSMHSEERAQTEKEKGFTCDNTGAGPGPRRDLRIADADAARGAAAFINEATSFIAKDIKNLNSKLASRPSKLNERAGFVDELNRDLELMIRRYNTFQSDPELLQIRDKAVTRLETKSWDNRKNGKFSCSDQKLEDNLRNVIRSINGLRPLEIREVPKVLGSRATMEAFSRLGISSLNTLTTMATLAGKIHLPSSLEKWFGLHNDADLNQAIDPSPARQIDAQIEGGLARDDWSALIVAAVVDFCLFVVAMDPRRYQQRLLADVEAARLLASDLRKLNPDITALELFNNYIFTRSRTAYIAVPEGVPLPASDHPQRRLREQDRLMALMSAALYGSSAGIMRRLSLPILFRPRRALMARGRIDLAKHREFGVYKLYRNTLQDILSALILHPEDNPTLRSMPPPLPGDRDRRRMVSRPSPQERELAPERPPAEPLAVPPAEGSKAPTKPSTPPREPRGRPF